MEKTDWFENIEYIMTLLLTQFLFIPFKAVQSTVLVTAIRLQQLASMTVRAEHDQQFVSPGHF